MRLTAISGLGVKGPACFLLEAEGRRLLLDLGRGPDGDALPDLGGIGPVDAILFSHGHKDHTGGLHLAERLGQPPLFATEPTVALSTDPAMRAAQPYEDWAEILGLPFACGPSGHAPGACWMRIGGEGGLLYTGDASEEGRLWPFAPPPRAAALVFDASYGAAEEPLADQVAGLLALAEDGPLLLPAPAGGRGLEMALAFRDAGREVALCPAHRRVAEAMAARPRWLAPGGAEALARLLETTATLTEDSPLRGVMIAAGPNAERDTAAALAPRLAGRGRIVFTGHLAEGTPAPRLVAEGRALFRRWNVHPRLAGLRQLLADVAPTLAMPAFCTGAAAAELARALDRPLACERVMAW